MSLEEGEKVSRIEAIRLEYVAGMWTKVEWWIAGIGPHCHWQAYKLPEKCKYPIL